MEKMEKKIYQAPEMETVEIKLQANLLVQSEGPGKDDEEVDF